jgi:hypothetical protein
MHYRALLVTHPPQVENKTEFIKWTREIHNAVNRNTNKTEWSHEDFMAHYQKKIRRALDNNFSRSGGEDENSEIIQRKELENQELRSSLSELQLENKRILDIQLRDRLHAHAQKRGHDRTRTNLLVVIAATVLVLMMVLGAWFFSYRRWHHKSRHTAKQYQVGLRHPATY